MSGWTPGFVLLGRGNEAQRKLTAPLNPISGWCFCWKSWKSLPFGLQTGRIKHKQFTQPLQFLQSFDFDLIYNLSISVLKASCEFFADREGQLDQDFPASPKASSEVSVETTRHHRCSFTWIIWPHQSVCNIQRLDGKQSYWECP